MCGLAGFIGGDTSAHEAWPGLLQRMGDAIAHRGPDDSGTWMDVAAGVGLVHRRLSIVDLSSAGHQPMASASGRYLLVFNGEIYNHLDLRAELARQLGICWRGHSDTEVLLAGFEFWGLRETVRRAVGMFAFALWDRQTRTLTLGRDRLGEKPLYYGWQGQGRAAVFLFGSELKALRAHPAFEAEIDRNALGLQMRHNCVPAPWSIYRGIRKLEPGTLLEVGSASDAQSASLAYWSFFEVMANGLANPFAGTEAQAIDALDQILRRAVSHQMLADVPLGAFLSGGIDSSTIVALMQAQSNRPVKTFSIGFNESGYDEAPHAMAVARHLGTDHTELYVSPSQAMDVIGLLPSLYDEPFSDSSQIPTYLVSRLARSQVVVSLSGDAGDELFGGYGRYVRADATWRFLERFPGPLRRGVARAIRSLSINGWNRAAAPVTPLLPVRARNVGDKAHKFADLMNHEEVLDFYQRFMTHWDDPASVVLQESGSDDRIGCSFVSLPDMGNIASMMASDTLGYLPDDILVKVDRAAMGVSLETRVPMLDHRLVEFAWQLPMHMKVRDGQGKWILRQVLARYVPTHLTDRPKMGFGVPIGNWLRGPLRDWAEDLLDESRLRREGYLHAVPIRKKWSEHLSGSRNWQNHLWDVLMFQAWLQQQKQVP